MLTIQRLIFYSTPVWLLELISRRYPASTIRLLCYWINEKNPNFQERSIIPIRTNPVWVAKKVSQLSVLSILNLLKQDESLWQYYSPERGIEPCPELPYKLFKLIFDLGGTEGRNKVAEIVQRSREVLGEQKRCEIVDTFEMDTILDLLTMLPEIEVRKILQTATPGKSASWLHYWDQRIKESGEIGSIIGSIYERDWDFRNRRLEDVESPLKSQYWLNKLPKDVAQKIYHEMKYIDSEERRARGENTNKTKILFLGANPSDRLRLDLGKEVSKIQTNLKMAKERDNLELKQEWAVTTESFMRAILDESPTIVHFSGHGDQQGIILRDEAKGSKLVKTEALADLFKVLKRTISIECIVLNSCYSEEQAKAIKSYIPHVIGMRASIPDQAAISFTTGFYQALGAGKDIPSAFDLGISAIKLEGITGDSIPTLL